MTHIIRDPTSLCHEEVFIDSIVCAGRKKHPILTGKLTLDAYVKAKHINITYREEYMMESRVDQSLELLGRRRNVVFSSNHIMPIIKILSHSDYVTCLPRSVALQHEDLTFQPVPVDLPQIRVIQIRHPYRDNDLGLQWLRGVIKDIMKSQI